MLCVLHVSCVFFNNRAWTTTTNWVSLFSLWTVRFSWPFSTLHAISFCLSWGELKKVKYSRLNYNPHFWYLHFRNVCSREHLNRILLKFPYKTYTQKNIWVIFTPDIICQNLFLCATKNVFNYEQGSGMVFHSNLKFRFSFFIVYRERACICSTRAPKYFLFL